MAVTSMCLEAFNSTVDCIAQARALRQSGDRKKALLFWFRVLEIAPEHPYVACEIATDQRELGLLDEARETLVTHLTKFSNSVCAYIGLAQVERKQGSRELALEYFTHALGLKSDHPSLACEIAAEQRALKLNDEAQKTLLRHLQSHPNSVCALIGLAHIFCSLNNYQSALEYFLKAHEINPNHQNLPLEISRLLKSTGQVDGAIRCLLASLESPILTPGQSLYRQGLIAQYQEHHDEALLLWKSAVKATPSLPVAWRSIVLEYIRLGQFDVAESWIKNGFDALNNSVWAENQRKHLARVRVFASVYQAYIDIATRLNYRLRPKSVLKTDAHNEAKIYAISQPIVPIFTDSFLRVLEYDVVTLERAKNNFGSLKNVEFLSGDIRKLPFNDEVFDLVVDFSTIDHVMPSDVIVVLDEYKRTLIKGGVASVVYWTSVNASRHDAQWSHQEQYYFLDSDFTSAFEERFEVTEKSLLMDDGDNKLFHLVGLRR
jgi:tetratricopeptide (TPR) repeat protein